MDPVVVGVFFRGFIVDVCKCVSVCLFEIACVCMLQPFFDSLHVLLFFLFSFTHSLAHCVCLCVLFENSLLLLICLVCETHPLRCYICTVFFLFLYFEPKWYNGIFSSFILVELALLFFLSFLLAFYLSLLVFFLCLCIFEFFSCTSESSKCKANSSYEPTTQTIQNAYESHTHTHSRSNVL